MRLLCLQGEQLLDRLYIPRLRVRKNWYVGLNPDPVDHSHPDIGKAEGAENPFDHAAHAAQAAHQAAAAHATPSHAGHGAGTAHHPPPPHPHPPPPPHPQQHQPAQATSIPTQPLAQGQQPQQQAGGHAPAVPQSPPPPAAHTQPQPAQQQQPATQQPATQQPAQQQQQPATQQQPPQDMSAVLKVKERIDNYAKQFGQVSWQQNGAARFAWPVACVLLPCCKNSLCNCRGAACACEAVCLLVGPWLCFVVYVSWCMLLAVIRAGGCQQGARNPAAHQQAHV